MCFRLDETNIAKQKIRGKYILNMTNMYLPLFFKDV